jgi:hypothetical protein
MYLATDMMAELLVISDCTDSLHVQQQILGHDRGVTNSKDASMLYIMLFLISLSIFMAEDAHDST